MSEASERLLQRVRSAEEPSAADEERLLRALQDAVATGKVSAVSERVTAALDVAPSHAALPALKLVGPLAALASLSLVALIASLHREPLPEQPRQPAKVTVDTPLQTSTAQAPRDAAPDSASRLEPAANRTPRRTTTHAPRLEPARPAPAPQTAPPSTALDQAAELALLRRVQAALRREDGATALAELDAFAHAQGALRAERQAARVLSLCLLGRSAEARQAALAFEREHPDSPQRAAIAGSCANPKRNEAP